MKTFLAFLQCITVEILILLLWNPGILPIYAQEEHENIKHEVSVTRKLIPVLAYDSQGQPVPDLKKEDLTLFVNGKPVKIDSLEKVQFTYDRHSTKTIREKKMVQAPVQKRIIFLVVDTMFNSFYGVKNSKKIARDLIDNDPVNSQFVILHNTLYGGLKLLGGPETDRQTLKKMLRKISHNPEYNPMATGSDISIRSGSGYRSNSYSAQERRAERKHEKEKMKIFVSVMSRLKYTLEAISGPKLVFLISRGLPEILFIDEYVHVPNHVIYDSSVLQTLQKLGKEINAGGSILYTIYPGRLEMDIQAPGSGGGGGKGGGIAADSEGTLDNMFIPITRESGIESLKLMAAASGGRLFEAYTDKIVKEIHTSTAAFYELAYSPPKGKTSRIKITSSRRGVRVNTLAQTETYKSYKNMEPVRKKVFAMNAVLGRSWVKDAGQLQRASYTWKDWQKKMIDVHLPITAAGRPVDIYLIRFDRDFKNPKITLKHKKAAAVETLTVDKYKADSHYYFLVVEPDPVNCYYNRIRQ